MATAKATPAAWVRLMHVLFVVSAGAPDDLVLPAGVPDLFALHDALLFSQGWAASEIFILGRMSGSLCRLR